MNLIPKFQNSKFPNIPKFGILEFINLIPEFQNSKFPNISKFGILESINSIPTFQNSKIPNLEIFGNLAFWNLGIKLIKSKIANLKGGLAKITHSHEIVREKDYLHCDSIFSKNPLRPPPNINRHEMGVGGKDYQPCL